MREIKPSRGSLLGIIGGLMVAENLGDVHDELVLLCKLAGIPKLEGNFVEGWTPQDYENVGMDYDEDEDELEEQS